MMQRGKDVKLKSFNRPFILLGIVLVILLAAGFLYSIGGRLFPAFGLYPPEIDVAAFSKLEASDYTKITKTENSVHEGDLILVNKDYPLPNQESTPLVCVYDKKNNMYKVKDTKVTLSEHVMEPFNRMLEGFYNVTGIHDVNLLSGYRSSKEQADLIKEKGQELRLQDLSQVAAAPTQSEHETGLAVDLGIYTDMGIAQNFIGQGKYRWIHENAAYFGFILRYPEDKTSVTGYSYEPWHFRYVGKIHATIMEANNFCLEEYLLYLKEFPFEAQHLLVTDGHGEHYEIYYVAATGQYTELPVPSKQEYTVSGNNMDGFIVTVHLS